LKYQLCWLLQRVQRCIIGDHQSQSLLAGFVPVDAIFQFDRVILFKYDIKISALSEGAFVSALAPLFIVDIEGESSLLNPK
jgi:hypothetical protein